MENHRENSSANPRNPLILFFMGILPIIAGLLNIFVSLNLLEYVDTRPNRIAIFNDPHTWEVFALGTTLLFFGVGNLLPPRMKSLIKLNTFLFLISLVAVIIGVILKKIN